jgi:hypothetical protein
MRYIIVFVITLVLHLVSSPTLLASDTPKTKVTGIYSDLAYYQESGDLLGDEIMVLFSEQGYFVVLQYAEGVPSKPVLVPAVISGQRITFMLPPPMDDWGAFVGEIEGDHLVGKFQRSEQALDLRRKNSYWQ